MLFEVIKKYNNTLFFFEVEIISADTLSRKQQRFDSINLNTISHNAAIKLLRSALSQGFKVTDVYVDTVGDANKYREYIRSRIPEYLNITKNITVQPKADQDHKVVSASSVCAKVTRDKII
jgi:ribonuclease H2 subunit A